MEKEKPKKQMVIEDKISIFGALGMSKPVRQIVIDLLDVEKQRLVVEEKQNEILGKIESGLAKSATAQATTASLLSRVVYALETQNTLMRRS
ncbi:MAG: hypothetical protein ABH864_03870 [archaeon]